MVLTCGTGVHTQASSLQHSSSAPSYVFCAQSDSIYSQKQAGACHRLAGSAISGGDKAQLTANLCADFSSSGRMGVAAWDCAQQQQQPEDTSALGAIGFQLHSRLEVASTYSQSSLLRQQAWCTRSELLQQGGGAGQHQQVSAREASQGSVEWFEEKLQEVSVCVALHLYEWAHRWHRTMHDCTFFSWHRTMHDCA